MLEINLERETSAPATAVVDTLREKSPEARHRYWSNVTPERFKLHDSGPGFIEVTEATFLVGVFWEHSRYEWTGPHRVIGTVLDSNVFKPGSTWELSATPRERGGSEVRLLVRRQYQRSFKGRVAATINHLGGHRLFGWYLGTVLKAVEAGQAEPRTESARA